MRAVVLWGMALAAVTATPAVAQLIVTQCGTVVPAGVPAVLGSDLDCSAAAEDEAAVHLSNGGRLDLRGHTLTAVDGGNGVRCCAGDAVCRCSVTSSAPGGRIVGGDYAVFARGNLTVTALALDGAGIYSEARVSVADVTVGNSTSSCVRGDRVKVKRVTCSACGTDGISGDTIRGEDLTVSGCGGAGVDGFLGRAVLKRATITGNGHAPTPGRGSGGVLASKVLLIDVTATGNLAGPLLAPLDTPADVFTSRKPRLQGSSTCTHSAVMGNYTENWGVCTAD